MKIRKNVFFVFLFSIVVIISITSCSKNDDKKLTIEQSDAIGKKVFLKKINANYDHIISKEWRYKAYKPSDKLEAASKTSDGADALTIVQRSEDIVHLKPILRFEADGDSMKVKVDFGIKDAEISDQLVKIQENRMPWSVGIYSKESLLSDYRRFIASPFAASSLTIAQITNDDTGLCIFSIIKRDYSELSYDDTILASRKLIAGNANRIYFNEDGTLTVESINEKYGVSKLILEENK